MARLSRSCTGRDDFAGASSTGATLPFLPTLVVAAVIALGAVCWESVPQTDSSEPVAAASVATPTSSEPPRMARLPFADVLTRPDDPQGLAAVAAFAERFPLTIDRPAAVARAEPRPPSRPVRVAVPHGRCGGERCREAPTQTASTSPRRPPAAPLVPAEAQPFAAAVVEAEPPEEALPDRLMPFAPTVRAVQRTVGFVGAQAAALRIEAAAVRGAVGDLVGGLR